MSSTRSPSAHGQLGDHIGQGIGRTLEVLFSVYASVVFIVLWAYVVAATLTDSAFPAETWAWLTSLDVAAAVVVWLAILPVGVFLWAWQADLSTLVMGIVMLGLIAWTAVAFSGLAKMLHRRLAGLAI